MGCSICGWSCPAGCHRVPGDKPEPPCSLCGEPAATGECPEGPQCGAIGCIVSLTDAELTERSRVDYVPWPLERLEAGLRRAGREAGSSECQEEPSQAQKVRTAVVQRN